MSVSLFVRVGLPEAEGADGIGAGHVDAGQVPLLAGKRQLFVDICVGEVDGGGVLLGVAEVDTLHAGPVECAQAHGAWLAAAVDGAAGKRIGVERGAGIAYGLHLGVSRGVVEASDAVDALPYYLPAARYDRAEGSAAAARALGGEVYGPLHILRAKIRMLFDEVGLIHIQLHTGAICPFVL